MSELSRRCCMDMVKWTSPPETRAFVELVMQTARLLDVEEVEALMEPTGTYGEPLRALLLAHGAQHSRIAGSGSVGRVHTRVNRVYTRIGQHMQAHTEATATSHKTEQEQDPCARLHEHDVEQCNTFRRLT